MKMRTLLPAVITILLSACAGNNSPGFAQQHATSTAILNKSGSTLAQRFLPPKGFQRQQASEGSISHYFRNLPLKPHNAPVLYFDGAEKENPGIYAAVVRMDIGNKDLQQCADAVMRLRAEYLYSTGQQDKIRFNFTSGFNAEWSKWRAGNRIAVKGNSCSWIKTAAANDDYPTFRSYLEKVFSYAGTLSLSRELRSVPYADLMVGDVFIQGGSPGHAITVMDVATHAAGKKMYLLSQSYMPAQETQILHNPANPAISPWYELDASQTTIRTPQWDFTSGDLKRFP